MVLSGDKDTELVMVSSVDYLVRGSGSGNNKIEPDTDLLKSGYGVDFDGTWYVVQATGVYEIELTCDLEAWTTSPASSITFSVLTKNSGVVVYTSGTIPTPTNPNGEPIVIRFKSNLGVGNGYRIQGVTDATSAGAMLKNMSLKIKRVGNVFS
jgi:hypothetical protein